MIKREIEISGKKVPFRSSATTPRLYRAKFKRDIFKDLSKLEKSYRGKTENGEELLSTLDSDEELNRVYDLFMEQLMDDEDGDN